MSHQNINTVFPYNIYGVEKVAHVCDEIILLSVPKAQ
jgi:hypothetical protein